MKLSGNALRYFIFFQFFSIEFLYAHSQNFWLPRSFSSYSTHDILQERFLYNPYFDHDEQKLQISFLTEYAQSFHKSSRRLGALPWWSGSHILTVGNNDGKADLDAYQCGFNQVATDRNGIAGTLELHPTVRQIGSDLLLYYTRGKTTSGMFFKVHIPVGAMSIHPHFKQTGSISSIRQVDQTMTTSPGGELITYKFPEYPLPGNHAQSLLEYFAGASADESKFKGNITKQLRLRKGRIALCEQTNAGFGDLSMTLGYNFFTRKKGFAACGVKVLMPTSRIHHADLILEPVFGRSGSWGLGVEATGLYRAWEHAYEERYLDLWLQGQIQHVFSGRKQNMRTFDLKKNGPGSKFLLIQEYVSTFEDDSGIVRHVISPQRIQPASNITTLPIFSKIAVEGSVAAMMDYHHETISLALGVEFWGRTREILSIDTLTARNVRHPNLNDYAVIGRQVSQYIVDNPGGNLYTITSGYCEPHATISKSKDPLILTGTLATNIALPSVIPDEIKDARIATSRIPEKYEDALDIAGAQADSAWSCRCTGQISHVWAYHCYLPTVSCFVGAELSNRCNVIDVWTCGVQASIHF